MEIKDTVYGLRPADSDAAKDDLILVSRLKPTLACLVHLRLKLSLSCPKQDGFHESGSVEKFASTHVKAAFQRVHSADSKSRLGLGATPVGNLASKFPMGVFLVSCFLLNCGV